MSWQVGSENQFPWALLAQDQYPEVLEDSLEAGEGVVSSIRPSHQKHKYPSVSNEHEDGTQKPMHQCRLSIAGAESADLGLCPNLKQAPSLLSLLSHVFIQLFI